MIERRGGRIAAALILLLTPTIAIGAERGQARALRPLLDCRAQEDAAARLACFDRESAVLDQADRKNELTVLDKEDVRKTRRSLFGLNLSDLPFVGGSDADDADDGRTSITGTIVSARSIGNGLWAFTLDENIRWATTEEARYPQPAAGMTVLIKKGALGSFTASFAGKRTVKVRRIN